MWTMRLGRGLPLLALLLAAGVPGTAQYHTAGYFGVTFSLNGVTYGVKSDTRGTVTSMTLGTRSHVDCEVAADNQTLLVPDPAAAAIWVLDPNAMAVTGTLLADPALAASVWSFEHDHNGDLYAFTGGALLRITPGTGLTTVATGRYTFANAAIDIDTTDLLVATGSITGTLARIDRLTGQTTTVATGLAARYGDAAQDVLTGDMYVPTCCGTSTIPRSLDVVRAGQSVATIFVADPILLGAYGPRMDRVSAARPRLVTGCFRSGGVPGSGGIWTIDVASGTVQKLASFQITTIADVELLEGRNIHATRTAPGRYTIDVSIPPDASRGFVLGASLNGVRPFLTLGDGRRIPLVPDALTVLTAQNLAAPFIAGTVGALDPFGRARATIDVSTLYPGIRGLLVWLVAVTFDPAAPLGISTITDPFVLRFD